jgi:hypothetical protein
MSERSSDDGADSALRGDPKRLVVHAYEQAVEPAPRTLDQLRSWAASPRRAPPRRNAHSPKLRPDIGELAELLVAIAVNGTRARRGEKGWDVRRDDGGHIQVKAAGICPTACARISGRSPRTSSARSGSWNSVAAFMCSRSACCPQACMPAGDCGCVRPPVAPRPKTGLPRPEHSDSPSSFHPR